MKNINKRIKVGTKVLIEGLSNWVVVKEIANGKWIKIQGYNGSFQSGHILKFTNK